MNSLFWLVLNIHRQLNDQRLFLQHLHRCYFCLALRQGGSNREELASCDGSFAAAMKRVYIGKHPSTYIKSQLQYIG